MWWDKSDAWLEASEAAEGREQAQLVKQSLDAAQTALRHWRTLKFPIRGAEAPAGTAKRGRLVRGAQGDEGGDLMPMKYTRERTGTLA